MSFLKRHWLYAIGLVALLCVTIGAFLAWRANQPVESKTVYVMPEPNPDRAEILKRITQPKKSVYAPRASIAEATDALVAETPDVTGGESSSQENDVENDDIESMLAAIDEETAEENSDFPPIPEGYLDNNPKPVWLSIPGYRKGDMTDHENIARVLIKLWNQGDHGFKGGFHDPDYDRVYPLYPEVLYVEWRERIIDNQDGTPPLKYRSISASAGIDKWRFNVEDFVQGGWETKYPGLKLVDFQHAGYNPQSFLTEED